jgi:acetyl/propionyl-CoA carboxylase alpha subunit
MAAMRRQYLIGGKMLTIETSKSAGNSQRTILVDGVPHHADIVCVEPNVYSVLIDGRSTDIAIDGDGHVWVGSARLPVEIRDPRKWSRGQGADAAHGTIAIAAAMPGKVVAVLVHAGETIETGKGVLVIEAMKMQNELKSPKAGVVQEVRVTRGDSVAAGQVLVIVE